MPIRRDELGDRVLQRIWELWGPKGGQGRRTQDSIAKETGIRQQDLSAMLSGKKPVVPLMWYDQVLRVFGKTLVDALLQDDRFRQRVHQDRPSLDRETEDLDEEQFRIVLDTARRLAAPLRKKHAKRG